MRKWIYVELPRRIYWVSQVALFYTTPLFLHNLHWRISVSPLTFFQALVSTICSNVDIMPDVFLGVKFYSSHILHFFFCFFVYFTLHFLFFLYCLSLFSSTLFLKHFYTCFHIVWILCPIFFVLISYLSLKLYLVTFCLHCQYHFIHNWLFPCFLFPSFFDPPIIEDKHVTPYT